MFLTIFIIYLLVSFFMIFILEKEEFKEYTMVLHYPITIIFMFLYFVIKRNYQQFKHIFFKKYNKMKLLNLKGEFDIIRFKPDEDLENNLKQLTAEFKYPRSFYLNKIEKRIQKKFNPFWYKIILYRRKKYYNNR